jgi:hypothetical protein
MKIKNTQIFGLESSIIRSGYPMQIGEPDDMGMPVKKIDISTINDITDLYFDDNNSPILMSKKRFSDSDYLRSKKLANTPVGSGHNNFLKGIIVQFDLLYPQYFTPQLQRYHWVDIISSQSKMHRITKIENLSLYCNRFVLDRIINEVEILIEIYNENKFPYELDAWSTNYEGHEKITIQSKEDCFQYIISNLPMGYEMWMAISTNYLQLKTIYNQRKHHKLKEDWGYFCDWIEKLPMANELIIN